MNCSNIIRFIFYNMRDQFMGNFKIDNSYCLPFVPPNKKLDEMVTDIDNIYI